MKERHINTALYCFIIVIMNIVISNFELTYYLIYIFFRVMFDFVGYLSLN